MNNIGEKIKYYRQLRNFSQMDLEIAIDASFGSLSRIENEKVNPTKETLSKIASTLKLSPSEISDLMGLNILSSEDLIKAINKFSTNLTLKATLQTAVDSLFNLFPNYNGGIIFLIDKKKNAMYSQTVSNMPKMEEALKYIPKPVIDLTVPLDDLKNLVVKSIVRSEFQISDSLYDFIYGAVSYFGSSAISKILGFKVGISFPIIVEGEKIGAVLYAKRIDNTFNEYEKNILKLLTEQIGISIVKSRLIEGKEFLTE